jgi:hypothetical protein
MGIWVNTRRPVLSGDTLVPDVTQVPARSQVERRNLPERYAVLRRVFREFDENPGLAMTPAQAGRLFGLSPDTAARILQRLADTEVLDHTRTGQFTLRVTVR